MAGVANGALPPPPPPPPPFMPPGGHPGSSQQMRAPPPPPGALPGPPRPHSGHHSSRDKQKEAQRRAEEEKRRREKEKERESREAARQQQQAPENRLRRETPFLAHIRFRNDLPEIPSDPKMLVSRVQPDRLAQFSLTSLEKEPRRALVLPPDLGISISLLDVERYQTAPDPRDRPPLDPEDKALLGEDVDDRRLPLVPLPTHTVGRANAGKVKGAEVSWLMRTTYISSDTDVLRRQGINEKKAKSMRMSQSPSLDELEGQDREAHIRTIEETFRAAQQPPVHHKDPSLQPLEILPLFPDFECWAHKYIKAHFDTDPTHEIEALSRLPPDMRHKVAARCMLKGFKLDNVKSGGAAPGQERFMALVVPSRVRKEGEEEALIGSDPSELEGDYIWSKEYVYDLDRSQRDAEGKQEFFLVMGEGQATYCDINAKLDLKKRDADAKTRGKGEGAIQFARPAKVVIQKRELTAAEEDERQRKLRRLYGEEDEYQGDVQES